MHPYARTDGRKYNASCQIYPIGARTHACTHARTHTHARARAFNGPLSETAWVSRYQKGEPILILLKQETQWHPLGHMQVCTSLQTDNHVSMPPLSFLQAGCPSCRPTNCVKALKDTIR